jgi:hypothetical protein
MQPVQLSLLATEIPTPPQQVAAELPEDSVAEAVRLLARLIVKAATATQRVTRDE